MAIGIIFDFTDFMICILNNLHLQKEICQFLNVPFKTLILITKTHTLYEKVGNLYIYRKTK